MMVKYALKVKSLGEIVFRMLLGLFLGLLGLPILIIYFTGFIIYFPLKILWRILKFTYHEMGRRCRKPSLLCYNKDTNSLEVLR
jgi:hypothetical protein